MRTYLTIVCLGISISLFAQSNDRNHIVTYTPREVFLNEANVTYNTTAEEVNKAIEYVDGLGRPLQTVGRQLTPAGQDQTQIRQYDMFGRPAIQRLPYQSMSSDGSFKSNAKVAQESFYQSPPPAVVSDPSPYAITVFEPAPLIVRSDRELPEPTFNPVRAIR